MQLPTIDPSDIESFMKLLENMTSTVGEIQEKLLEEILRKNAKTEYLKGYLDGCPSKELFKENVPVVKYEDIKHYIDRVANGEPSEIITTEPIAELYKSSGTSGGKLKLFPTTTEEANRKAFFYDLANNILAKYVEFVSGGKRMFFRFVAPDVFTTGGLVVRYVSSGHFRSKTLRKHFWTSCFPTSPDEVILCEDSKQSMYCQLLCGLVQRDTVVRVGTTFASIFIRVIKFLEENWQELCSNIRTGLISDWVTDLECRKAVALILNNKMPNLADLIEFECKRESWEGIIKKIWPRTQCVEVITTGSMEQYVPKIEFYSGGLPLISLMYGSSEGFFGINLNPLSNPYDVTYSLIPWMAYYEFLPVDLSTNEKYRQDDPDPGKGVLNQNCMMTKDDRLQNALVDLANVKIGQHYELVVTTYTGLYRYRVGDILEVSGFYNNAPQFKFLQRENVSLSVDTEKTTEEDLFKAVKKAMHILESLGYILTDYTSYANLSCTPGHYVLFWELQMEENSEGIVIPTVPDQVKMEECCSEVEGSLDMKYKGYRQSNVIAPLEIRVVKKGTFDALMGFFVSQGTALSQYKTPKCIKSDKAIGLLNSKVVGSFSSRVMLPN